MWYIYIREYYSAIKKNEILPFSIASMDLEGIMLSEISQREKDKHYILSLRNLKNKTNDYNKTETDLHREQTSGYQWGEGSKEGQDRGRGLRGTNYYV